MDRDEALRLLRGGEKGIAEWNERRLGIEMDFDLSGVDLHSTVLRGANFNRINLRGADLSESVLQWADLRSGIDLSGANLRRADLRDARLGGANLCGADLREADLSHANLEDVNLIGAHLAKANLFGVELSRSNLSGVDCRGISLVGLNLERTDFSEADLSHANLGGASLREAKFPGAKLVGVYLGSAQLHEADLRKADLSRANLHGADLNGAYLSGANLRDANLGEAKLRCVNFNGADLRGAFLEGAFLEGADLTGADFTGANLSLARLIRCRLDNSVFDDANVDDCHVHDTIGMARPPNLLRVGGRPLLTGEDARNFFYPPATVEVYVSEFLNDEELGAFHFHLGDMRRQEVGIGVHLVGERNEGGGTVLRFHAPTYAEIYDVLPTLLKPFRMSRAVDWVKTYEDHPEHDRGAMLTALAKIEAEDPEGRWPFASRMAEVFGSYPGAKITHLRDGRSLGVRIEVATNQAMYRKLAPRATRSKPLARQQIIYLPAGESPRIAMEDHSVTNDIKAQGNIVGSAIGSGNTANVRDINAFISGVNQADGLDADLRRVLIEARQALEAGPSAGTVKDDAADDLGKLAEEVTKPEPQPGRIKMLFDRIKQLAPDVASILSSAAKIGELIKG